MLLFVTYFVMLFSTLSLLDSTVMLLAILINILVLLVFDIFVLIYIMYEISIITFVPIYLFSVSTARVFWAVYVLYICNTFGFWIFIMFILFDCYMYTVNISIDVIYFNTGLSISILGIVVINIPSYPVYFWLPEAHVEIAWLGSILLAAVILNYSLLLLQLFGLNIELTICILITIALFTGTITSVLLLMLMISDINVFGAQLSIFHMNVGLLSLLLTSLESLFWIDVIWVVHSMCAMWYFWVIGIIYAYVGARTIHTLVVVSIFPLLANLILILIFINIGIPIGLFFIVEVCIVSVLSSILISSVLWLFCMVLYVFVIICNLINILFVSDINRGYVDILSYTCIYGWFILLFIIEEVCL